MLIKRKVITPGSLKLTNLEGKMEVSTMVMIKIMLTKIRGAQPVEMFLDAARQRGQT